MKKIISVVGARPNFIKVAPLHKAFNNYASNIQHLICHTGQHYDENMSKIFFDELSLPMPDFYLGVGSGSHAQQTAGIMIEFEKILINQKPDLVIVVGDVNSTIACSLVAKKLYIKVAHIEAGLRSFDMTMPEEINRILTDAISDYLFVTEHSAIENLKREGAQESKIFFTGNVMIDTLLDNLKRIDASDILARFDVHPSKYILATFHRPGNVDDKEVLENIAIMLNRLGRNHKVVFPVHPRTKNNLIKTGLFDNSSSNIIFGEPLGYIDFLCLLKNAAAIITDSGGIQEESTYLSVPCVTFRSSTERPVTVEMGTNFLVGTNIVKAEQVLKKILTGKIKKGVVPPLWDGKAAQRITSILAKELIGAAESIGSDF